MTSEAADLKKIVEKIVNSGEKELDETDVKKVKKVCKSNPASLPFTFDLLLTHLKRRHAQVRVSTLQLTDVLFRRSHQFREILVERLRSVIELVVETDGVKNPLPPPKEAREQLKKLGLDTVRNWVKDYGKGYKKLELGFNYLKQVKRVDFNDFEARSEVQRRVEAEKKTKMDNIWRERVKKVKLEMEEKLIEIQDCMTQMKNCFELLRTDEFWMEDKKEDDELLSNDDQDSLRHHGIFNKTQKVEISVGETSSIKKTSDNQAVIENLRDQYRLLDTRFLPMVRKWSVTLTKAGENCNQDTLKRSIDIRMLLEEAAKNAKEIDEDIDKKKEAEEDSSDDDDDFVEVEEGKLDYEEEVLNVDPLLGIPFYERPSTSGMSPSLKRTSSGSSLSPSTSLKKTASNASSSSSWTLSKRSEEEDLDPTTFSATLKKVRTKLGSEFEAAESENSSSDGGKQGESVPVLNYDVDLYNWGEKSEPTKVLIDNERLRFWGGGGRDEDEIVVPGSDVKVRTIEFAGKFEPVRWSCRAPLPSGRLCPRRDREKCPIHGKIIARDNTGEPSNPEDRFALLNARAEANAKNPDWQDPKLLADIKAQTGKDLKVPKKGERKKKKEKKYGLTSIKSVQDTARKRLEKKVFNRSSLKKVAASLNKAAAKRHGDKFADQFNYVFNT